MANWNWESRLLAVMGGVGALLIAGSQTPADQAASNLSTYPKFVGLDRLGTALRAPSVDRWGLAIGILLLAVAISGFSWHLWRRRKAGKLPDSISPSLLMLQKANQDRLTRKRELSHIETMAKLSHPQLPEPDVSLVAALWRGFLGNWNVPPHIEQNIQTWTEEPWPGYWQQIYDFIDKEPRQAAFDGKLPIWGRQTVDEVAERLAQPVTELIPKQFWKHHWIAWLEAVRNKPEELVTQPDPLCKDNEKWRDLRTNRAAVERLWPQKIEPEPARNISTYDTYRQLTEFPLTTAAQLWVSKPLNGPRDESVEAVILMLRMAIANGDLTPEPSTNPTRSLGIMIAVNMANHSGIPDDTVISRARLEAYAKRKKIYPSFLFPQGQPV